MHARSHNLGFRTSIFGSQDLGFRTSTRGVRTWLSGPGFQALNARFQDLDLRTWVSGPRYLALRTRVSGPWKLSILRSSYLFPVTFLCVHCHFSLRPVVTDRQTDVVTEEEESERRTGLCILIHRQNRFCYRKCRPVPSVN
jgi:hypothetical protein